MDHDHRRGHQLDDINIINHLPNHRDIGTDMIDDDGMSADSNNKCHNLTRSQPIE